MTKSQREREWADAWREQMAEEQFPYRDMSPERYAARYGLGWKLWPFGGYRYRNAELNAWLERLTAILPSRPLIEQLQKQYLTAQEMEQVRREEEAWQREAESESA